MANEERNVYRPLPDVASVGAQASALASIYRRAILRAQQRAAETSNHDGADKTARACERSQAAS
jgi:hypothetical protein